MRIFKIFFLCSLLSLQFPVWGANSLYVSKLTIESLTNPIGIDAPNPRFSWQLESKKQSVLQNAYQIIVAESVEDLESQSNLVWNSGKVESETSVLVPFSGRTLESGKSHFWKVKVWTNKGESGWSQMANWTMAIVDQSLWKAAWIGMDSTLNSGKLTTKTRLSARYLRKEFTVNPEIKKATLYISGLGMYECYLNGRKISNDIFAPTATDYTKRVNYNVFDVKKFLNSSQNTIGVILGNGRFFSMRMENVPGGDPLDSPAQLHFGFPKLLFQLEIEYSNGSKTTVTSDSSWKINTEGPIVANNEFDGEEYDSNLELDGWDESGYNDKNWKNAQLVEAPKGKLV